MGLITLIADWFMLLQLLNFLLQLPIATVKADCCRSKTIAFELVDKVDTCSQYDARPGSKDVCHATVCDDGSVLVGNYCGHGSCNIFGCNCAGGCRKGDPLQLFRGFYGDFHIRNVQFLKSKKTIH